ncbi:cyclic peptide transporter, partial [Pseudomonas aeruginosa]
MTRTAESLAHETLTLLKPFWPHVLLSVLLGIAGGLSVTALLATINTAMNTEGGPNLHVALLFALLCV